jgi:phosphoglycerate dehydrogenase-like enzyme
MKRAAFFTNLGDRVDYVYGKGRRDRLGKLADLYPHVITDGNFAEHTAALSDIEVIFSTWGMWRLSDTQLAALPALRAVFYAAGTVKSFADPLLERGITLVSAWAGNGVPVAEFAFAQTILACKGYFRNVRDVRLHRRWGRDAAFRGPGVFGETAAILGAGQIGRKLIDLLGNVDLNVLVYDPFLTDAEAAAMGVEKVTLEGAFMRAYVITNHIPDLPETRGLIMAEHFAMMRDGAIFINTGRGRTVVEPDMIRVLRVREDLTALLDVTDPEPPPEDSPLYDLPNVHITSHIAGAINDEVVRLADYVIEEFAAWEQGEPLRYQVTPEMLDRMA